MASATQHDRRGSIETLVGYLCSTECAGRAPGTPGGEAARKRIIAELEGAGVAPAVGDSYVQPVPGCGANVLGRIAGSGPADDRAVLIAAHYDHLGQAPGGQVYWGADDNAAAVAILVDVARRLAARSSELEREVIVASFDGEEPPHFLDDTMGSIYYAHHPTIPLDRIDMMVCMDLLGHSLGRPSYPAAIRETIFALGAELSEGTGDLFDRVATRARGVRPRRLHLDVVPPLSDYYAFRRAGVPVLFLTGGRWEHYHSVDDTPEKLDYDKIVATADFLADLVFELSTRPEPVVDIDESGRDDVTSVETVRAMIRELTPFVDDLEEFLPALDAMAEAAARGPLPTERRHLLAAMVLQLENAMSL